MENTRFNEMPISDNVSGVSTGIAKKYYTVDEAIAYMEPRIRAMFR